MGLKGFLAILVLLQAWRCNRTIVGLKDETGAHVKGHNSVAIAP